MADVINAQRFRRVEDRGVKRARQCPCAVRLYHLEDNDVASRSESCSAILGVPSIGIRPPSIAVQPEDADVKITEAPPQKAADTERLVAPSLVSSVWPDTTILEVAMAALRCSQESADALFDKESGTNAKEAPVAAHPRRPVDTLPHYTIEILTATVNNEGCAVLVPLGTVSLRQVIPGHPHLVFPLLQKGGVDYNSALMDMPYMPGDPVLYSCTRTK